MITFPQSSSKIWPVSSYVLLLTKHQGHASCYVEVPMKRKIIAAYMYLKAFKKYNKMVFSFWHIFFHSQDSNAPVKVNPNPHPPTPPPRDMWGFSGALSPYWQLFESPVCGGFARFFFCFCPEECGALVRDSF